MLCTASTHYFAQGWPYASQVDAFYTFNSQDGANTITAEGEIISKELHIEVADITLRTYFNSTKAHK